MDPATYDFTIYQGATFQRLMTLKDSNGSALDLSSYHARMKIRRTWGSAPLLSLSDSIGEGGLVMGAASPNLTLTITATQTASLNFGYAVYDLEIESPGGVVDRLLQGRITLNRESTV